MREYKILLGNSKEKLKEIPDNSVDCCITSPPYYGLRDYGTGKWVGGDPNCPHRRLSKCSENTATGHAQPELAGNVGDAIYKTVCPLCGAVREDEQIGLEETPEEYISDLMDIFKEVKRVLKADGTFWLNIGDSYAGGAGRWGGKDEMSDKQTSNFGSIGQISKTKKWEHDQIKQKDLIGIPWMLAFALRNDGWYLRQDIIWHKPAPMPEPVKDRCVKSHEYIFLFSKSQRYFFDYEAIQEESLWKDDRRCGLGHLDYEGKRSDSSSKGQRSFVSISERRNKRDVWTVNVDHFEGSHFATFPVDLVKPMVLAGSRGGGTVLDPFTGSGTTGVVALEYGRNFIGCELNPEYHKMAEERVHRAWESSPTLFD